MMELRKASEENV